MKQAQMERHLQIARSDLKDRLNPQYPHLNDPELIAQIRRRIAQLEREMAIGAGNYVPVAGPCARRVVTCTIIARDGTHIVGTNWCADAQPVCPRVGNEGYEKCHSICKQRGHAEEVAVQLAGDAAAGAHAYIENHTYACRNCQETLVAAGIKAFTIGPPPEKT